MHTTKKCEHERLFASGSQRVKKILTHLYKHLTALYTYTKVQDFTVRCCNLFVVLRRYRPLLYQSDCSYIITPSFSIVFLSLVPKFEYIRISQFQSHNFPISL